MRSRPVIALDGPAGAGKSTVARKLAAALGFTLVDTGAIYRSVTLEATRRGVVLRDAAAVGEVARDLVARRLLRFSPSASGAVGVFLGDDDVSAAIRTPEVGMGASVVSQVPAVREALLDMQRQAGEHGGVVLEGRDIGTVVFPDAEVKFFLTASDEIRARRRQAELEAKGEAPTFERTLEEVRERDRQDSTRAIAPLRRADDAILVDSSLVGIDEVVASMLDHVRRKTAV